MDFVRKNYMDYSAFRFVAVVDFIEIEIHTAQKHLGGAIHNRLSILGFSHFTPVQANAGGWDSTFRTRLYDLKTFAALQAKVASIQAEVPFASPFTITRIEAAFDGYLKDDMQNSAGADELLAALAARMVYRIARPVSENRRIYRDYKGSPTAVPRYFETLKRQMGDGWNVGIGNKIDDQYQHGYLKTTDYNGQQLSHHLHRARLEIRLAGASLPHSDTESWASFKFESLAPHISFRKEDDTASTFEQAIVSAYADRASHTKSIRRREGGGIRKAIMPADRELNGIVGEKLRELSRRWTPIKRAK